MPALSGNAVEESSNMSKPFYILKHEHRVIERALRALDGMCMKLAGGDAVASEALIELIDFITTFADQYHHAKEERFLFPALERRGIPREGGPLGVMEHEHQVERELIAELRRSADAFGEGDEKAVRRFVDAAQSYLSLLVSHIEKEDSVLFRIGEEILEDEDKAALAKSFSEVDDALGGRSLEDYERTASALEEKWAL